METLLSLYHTFVYPYLSYCIHVWGKAYNSHRNDLIVLQNKAMRIISGVPPRTNIDKFYIDNNVLIVKHIYNYNIALFMYEYVNNMTPDVFDNLLSNISDIHQHNTVETLYSTIYYSKYFVELNFDKSTQYVALWTHKRHPIPRPFGRAMECLLWVLQQKLIVLYRVSTVQEMPHKHSFM